MGMLHETTQRRVCRFAFLAGCVVPTLLVIGFVARVWLPGYARRWETPLGQLLDCKVTIHQARTLRPGEARFKRLELLDPETNAVYATLEDVVHDSHDGRDRVSIAHATVTCSMGAGVRERIERLLRNVAPGDAELAIDELALLYGDATWNLSNVRGQLTANDAGRRIQLWSGDSEGGLRMLIARNRQIDPPATLLTLRTGSESLPCIALACRDQFDQFGPQAKFQGRIELIASRDSAKGKLSGQFSQLESSPTPLEVEELHWRGSANTIQSGLVEALRAHLRLREVPPIASTQPGDVAWELGPMRSWPRAASGATPDPGLVK